MPAWWREESPFSKELGLTKDQVAKIDKLWDETRPVLSKINEDLKRRENMLSELIKDDAPEAQVKMWIARVEGTRGSYNQTRQMMLYHMRQVLTAPQRVKFPQLHAQWLQDVNKAELERQQRDRQRQLNQGGKTDGKPAPPEQRGRPGQ